MILLPVPPHRAIDRHGHSKRRGSSPLICSILHLTRRKVASISWNTRRSRPFLGSPRESRRPILLAARLTYIVHGVAPARCRLRFAWHVINDHPAKNNNRGVPSELSLPRRPPRFYCDAVAALLRNQFSLFAIFELDRSDWNNKAVLNFRMHSFV